MDKADLARYALEGALAEREKLDLHIAELQRIAGVKSAPKTRKKFSRLSRLKMAAAQKEYWRKKHAAEAGEPLPAPVPVPVEATKPKRKVDPVELVKRAKRQAARWKAARKINPNVKNLGDVSAALAKGAKPAKPAPPDAKLEAKRKADRESKARSRAAKKTATATA